MIRGEVIWQSEYIMDHWSRLGIEPCISTADFSINFPIAE